MPGMPSRRAFPTRPRLAAGLLSLVLLCSGCASMDRGDGLIPGQSDRAQIRALYGEPVRRWANADGGETLEYSSQPFGRTCYLLTLDRAGRLQRVEETLNEASRFGTIRPGMTPEQVSRRLGQERSRVFFSNSGEEVWDWNVPPDQGGYLLRFNVHFKDGRVLRSSQSMVDPERFPWLER